MCLCMLLSLLPAGALAGVVQPERMPEGKATVSEKEYTIAPGIKEYEWVLNNTSMTEQMVGHVMEVTLGDNATIVAGYGDDNIENIASGNGWQMKRPTEQAQAMETRRNVNVVGVVNAAGFDMSNGCPTGALVMDGTFIKEATGTTFWIGKDNKAYISEKAEFDAAVREGRVREAVSAFTYGGLVRNGACVSGLDNATRASRTAIGIKEDGTVVMYMVNGRQAPFSVGMTMQELAEAMLALGCVNAENLDGGGSSMFATQREGEEDNGAAGLTMRCRPSDGVERTVSSSLMVVSSAQRDGIFNHATITPSQEIYTPGSTVQFTATGVDSGGYPVALPDGLTWEASAGTITADGVYTAPAETGSYTVSLKDGGKVVGTATIEVQWPDQLGFTNANVSLDFGQSSDLTFNPTYQGRPVHYKDGDFTWSLDESQPISYKYNALVETKTWYQATEAYRTQAANGNAYRVFISLTGSSTQQAVEWGLYETRTYKSYFTQTSSSLAYEDGAIKVNATVSHDKAEKLMKSNVWEEASADELLQEFHPNHSFFVGRFDGNRFVADENNSLRATVNVALANDPATTGSVDVIVGMEPLILMDFEDRAGMTAEEYWDVYYKNRTNGGQDPQGQGHLNSETAAKYGLYIRTATNKAIDFDGSTLVNSTEDSRVRFGDHAFKLCFNYTDVGDTDVAGTDFGFSSDLYVDTVQPTKIGMWINVPKELEDCPYLLKAIMAGGVTSETGNPNSLAGYNRLNPDGSFTFVPGTQEPKGTTMYAQYYGTAPDGTRLETLGDLAGRGWTWMEADISSMQMPIDVYRAYTVHLVKTATMTYKAVGHILVDNVQFIYGTNTNDINNPNVESITAKTGTEDILLSDNGMTVNNGSLSFEVLFDDNELTDKYATGIDTNTVRVSVDGVDYTGQVQFFPSSLTLAGLTLLNGNHTISVTMKDYYGNQTTLTRTFTVQAEAGEDAALTVASSEGAAPILGRDFTLNVTNKTPAVAIETATVKVDVPEKYKDAFTVTPGEGYDVTAVYEEGGVKLTVNKKPGATAFAADIATLTFSIPVDSIKGDVFSYTVSAGFYKKLTSTVTFSEAERRLPITASLNVSVNAPIAGVETAIQVTDRENAPASGATVYVNGAAIEGVTDADGQLSYIFPNGGRVTVYATTGEGRSWNESIVVCAKGDSYYNAPFGIQNNGTQDPQHAQSITWLCNIDTSAETPVVRYGTDAALTAYTEVNGTSSIVNFTESDSGTALRANTVRVSGLEPSATYYYQVGSGENWSEIRTFTTADGAADETNFFVLGDIQTGDTANLSAVTGRLKNTHYDFGVQTGDAIDGVNRLGEWRGFLTTLNSETLNGVDLIHTMGNHEYYGDAEGQISGTLYDLPASTQNSWYKMEYGSVCMVVVNHGANLAGALEEIAEQGLNTTCAWKVLVAHEPVYGTTDVMEADKLARVTAAVEAAGFDFVFGGDDHSYARTYPMLNGVAQAEDSREGVVYYISGDLSSKSNAFTKQEAHAFAMGHEQYKGAYITVNATEKQMTVAAYDYQGTLLDAYTETRTDCELGKHTASADSKYDMETGMVTCAACDKLFAEHSYTGLLATTDGKQVILAGGTPKKDCFTPFGAGVYHSDVTGYAHVAEVGSDITCTRGGHQIYKCSACGVQEQVGQFIMPKGHTWDADHVCTVCGTVGKNIEDADVIIDFGTVSNPRGKDSVPNYAFRAGGIRPSSFVSVDGGKTALTSSNDANVGKDGEMLDLFVEWPGNGQVGTAQVKYTGRGDYYGTRTLEYTIGPGASTLQVVSKDNTSITLKWSAAPGGADYYRLYSCNETNTARTLIAKVTDGTTYTVSNLTPGTEYRFSVRGMKTVEGTEYRGGDSAVLTASTTSTSGEIAGISAVVDGVELTMTTIGEENYLLLPASANLQELTLRLAVSSGEGEAVLAGSKGSVTLSGFEAQVDVAELSALSDGCYNLSARIGVGDALTFKVMQGSGIPTLYLTSGVDGEGRDFVDASKANETTGSMLMVGSDGATVYNGELTQIKARGNSTFAHYDKKSYQIKLADKTDLIGQGENVKTWVLLANYGDASMMHDKLFKDLAANLDMPYVAGCDWVNLYYDGEYRGVYLLSEKNSVGSTSVDITDMEEAYEAVNPDYGANMAADSATNKYGQTYFYTKNLTDPADITGGYLIELNHAAPDEVNGFITRRGKGFNLKSPEWASQEAAKYISEYYQAFEDAVYATDAAGNYTGYNEETGLYFYDYVDMDSLVKVFLMQELALNPDGFVSSLYFYKDQNGKMYAGPIWDQDMTLGTGWTKQIPAGYTYVYHYLAEALIQIPVFREAVVTYYNESFIPELEALTEDGSGYIDQAAARLADNAAMNYLLWPYIRVGDPANSEHVWNGASYDGVIADMKDWITTRKTVLDKTFEKPAEVIPVEVTTDTVVSGVAVNATENPETGKVEFVIESPADQPEGLTYLVWVSGKDDAFDSWQQVTAVDGIYSTDATGGEIVVHVYILGDANLDGNVDVGDAADMLHSIAGGDGAAGLEEALSDFSGDGAVDVGDVADMLKFIANS